MKLRLQILLVLLLTLLSQPVSTAHLLPLQATAPAAVSSPSAPPESSAEVRQQTFEIVWRTVKEKHFDPNMNGVNWDAVHERYQPQVSSVKSDNELYTALNKMLGELKQSHFSVIPPSAL